MEGPFRGLKRERGRAEGSRGSEGVLKGVPHRYDAVMRAWESFGSDTGAGGGRVPLDQILAAMRVEPYRKGLDLQRRDDVPAVSAARPPLQALCECVFAFSAGTCAVFPRALAFPPLCAGAARDALRHG